MQDSLRPRVLLAALFVGLGVPWTLAPAGNIDPDSDGSQYAYAENVGWLNAEPAAAGNPGVQVDDFELTGWIWGENIGWISLSCKNTSSCSTTDYGVRNDGNGDLTGYAWAENAGWINFAPATAGVAIDPTSGEFSGRAWGENVGWITLASSGPNPFKVTTAWRCVPAPLPPAGSPALLVDKSGADTTASWAGIAGATGFDLVKGSLAVLRSSGGDFALATEACLRDNHTTSSYALTGSPSPGDGDWFLVRGVNCGGDGTFDEGNPAQLGLRDAEIAASGNDCP